MSTQWEPVAVADLLDTVSYAAAGKVPSSKIMPAGKHPVIDQGRRLIAGWTDDDDVVIDGPLPVVVFGDHTRALKFVDFPFARGADGTQILRPKPGVDPLFFYYACRGIPLASRGYNRHFTLLKESVVELPADEAEQRSIGRVLRHVEMAADRHTLLVETTRELKRAAMTHLFTRGLSGEPSQDSEIGTIPARWVVEPLDMHHTVASGTTPARRNPQYWDDGVVPWVKTAEVNYCVISSTEEKLSVAAINDGAAKIFPSGTLLLAMYGQGVTRGKVALLGVDAACNQACAAITSTDGVVDVKYLYHFLTARYDEVRELAHGGQQQNLNLDLVRAIPVLYPPDKREQAAVVSVLDACDTKLALHERAAELFNQLFDGLLNALMSQRVQVTQCDTSLLKDVEQVIGVAS